MKLEKYNNGGEISSDAYFRAVTHFVYFCLNYPQNFLDAFPESSRKHLSGKFDSAYEKAGSYGAMIKFWMELDAENTKIFALWIKNNYDKSYLLGNSNIDDETYFRVVTHFVKFCLNYPKNFLDFEGGISKEHAQSKFDTAYEIGGTFGAMVYFWTELDAHNRRLFTSWIKDNYTGNKLENGGTIKEKKKTFVFADGSKFIVSFIEKDGKLFPVLQDTTQQDRVTSILRGEKSLAEQALKHGEDAGISFDKTLAKLLNTKTGEDGRIGVFVKVYQDGGDIDEEEYDSEKDLFQKPELIPDDVKAVLSKWEEKWDEGDGYANCRNMQSELEELGYTFDYYLDAEPYNLRKKEMKQGGNVKASIHTKKDIGLMIVKDSEGKVLEKSQYVNVISEFIAKKVVENISVKVFIVEKDLTEKDITPEREMKEGGEVKEKEYKVGNLVFAKNMGSRGLVGLIVKGKYNDGDEDVYDVYYRGYRGDIIPTPASDFESIVDGHLSFAEENGDLMHYPNIAKKLNIELSHDYQGLLDSDNDDDYKNGGDIHREHYRYISLIKVPNGIKVELDEQGKEFIAELKEDGKSDDDIFSELFDDVQGNSEYTFIENGGNAGFGLTDAPMILDGYHYGDNGGYETDYPESAKVYYFGDYMVVSPLEVMLKDGHVIFTEAKETGGDLYKKGGKLYRTSKSADASRQAKPSGYRYKNVSENNPNYYKRPTPPEILKFREGKLKHRIAFENRAERSDVNQSNQLEQGGTVGKKYKHAVNGALNVLEDYKKMIDKGGVDDVTLRILGWKSINAMLRDALKDASEKNLGESVIEPLQKLEFITNELVMERGEIRSLDKNEIPVYIQIAKDFMVLPFSDDDTKSSLSDIELKNIEEAVKERTTAPSLVGTKTLKLIIDTETKKINKAGSIGAYLKKTRNAFVPKPIYDALSKEDKTWIHSMGYMYEKDGIVSTSEGQSDLERIARKANPKKTYTPIKTVDGFKIIKNTNHNGNAVLFHLMDNNGNALVTDVTTSDLANRVKIDEDSVELQKNILESIKSLPVYWTKKDGSVVLVNKEMKDGGEVYTDEDGIKYYVGQKENGVWTVFSDFETKWKKRDEFEGGLSSKEDAIHIAKVMAGLISEYKNGGEFDELPNKVFIYIDEKSKLPEKAWFHKKDKGYETVKYLSGNRYKKTFEEVKNILKKDNKIEKSLNPDLVGKRVLVDFRKEEGIVKSYDDKRVVIDYPALGFSESLDYKREKITILDDDKKNFKQGGNLSKKTNLTIIECKSATPTSKKFYYSSDEAGLKSLLDHRNIEVLSIGHGKYDMILAWNEDKGKDSELYFGKWNGGNFGRKYDGKIIYKQGGEFKTCPESTEVQSLLFDKDHFTRPQAKAWAKKHNFKSNKSDITENNIRLRQEDPVGFQKDSFRTIEFGDGHGIKAVIACRK